MENQLSFLLSPFTIGFQLGQSLLKRSSKWGKIYFLLMGIGLFLTIIVLCAYLQKGSLAALFAYPLPWIESLLSPGSSDTISSPLVKAGSSILLLFLYVVLFSFPLSILFLPFVRRFQSSRPRLRSFSEKLFLKFRKQCPKGSYFAGIDALTGKPAYIARESRLMHTQIVGVTGAAKTEGGIVPALLTDIASGRGAVIICMKGDLSLLGRVTAVAKSAGRLDDLQILSMPFPESSNYYNPLARGIPTEIKDKIISSNIWTEEYYKKFSEMAVLIVVNAMVALQRPISLSTLLETMSTLRNIETLGAELKEKKIPNQIPQLLTALDRSIQPLSGLLADLTSLVMCDFGYLLSDPKGEIDFLEAYRKRKIVYVQLNAGLYQETAVRLARMIIQDIKSMCNYVQAYIPENERSFFSVFIDEFASIAFPAFTELINKARSANVAITIAHQSLGDLRQYGEFFDSQIFESSNIKMIFRQTDPRSVNLITEMGGTVETEKITEQTSKLLGEHLNTGMGSARMVEKFRIDPNIIRDLPRGYCVLIQRDIKRICYIQTEYLPFKGPTDFLEKRKRPRKIQAIDSQDPATRVTAKNTAKTRQDRLERFFIR
ncbi:MAG: TraM recognition domain-containing protein [Deltaproteobacteria bacterium]|nr:MAG: TraM recognition domain-containing protein [Deltaproteobacteria bacterium]